jgi:hypothetical protein
MPAQAPTKVEPFFKTACGTSKPVAHMLGAGSVPEYFKLSPRVRLVTVSTVCAMRGVDAEAVARMVDDALDLRHLRFAFNVGLGRYARELRFYVDELTAPAMVKNFTVQDAIGRILGGRSAFCRSEMEIAWTLGTGHFTRLIRANILKSEHGRFSRVVLEAFLFSRWSGNNPT